MCCCPVYAPCAWHTIFGDRVVEMVHPNRISFWVGDGVLQGLRGVENLDAVAVWVDEGGLVKVFDGVLESDGVPA